MAGQLANGSKVDFKYGPATAGEDGKYTGTASTSLKHLIRSLPDIAENREQVETTVLSSVQKTYINGLIDYGELEFGFLYDGKTAAGIKGIENQDGDKTQMIEVTLADGTVVKFPAELSLSITGQSSGSLMEMNIKCALKGNIEIEFAE